MRGLLRFQALVRGHLVRREVAKVREAFLAVARRLDAPLAQQTVHWRSARLCLPTFLGATDDDDDDDDEEGVELCEKCRVTEARLQRELQSTRALLQRRLLALDRRNVMPALVS